LTLLQWNAEAALVVKIVGRSQRIPPAVAHLRNEIVLARQFQDAAGVRIVASNHFVENGADTSGGVGLDDGAARVVVVDSKEVVIAVFVNRIQRQAIAQACA